MKYLTRPILVAVIACAASVANAGDIVPAAERTQVANFKLGDIKGKTFELKEHQGKVVALSFWASWCEPCKQELSFLNKYKKANPDKPLEIVAVATDAPETINKVKSIVKRKRWKFAVPLDTEGKVSAILNPRGSTPFAMFIDKTGKLAYSHEGYKSGDESHYEKILATLFGE